MAISPSVIGVIDMHHSYKKAWFSPKNLKFRVLREKKMDTKQKGLSKSFGNRIVSNQLSIL